VDDAGHPSLRTKAGRWRPRGGGQKFFTPKERVAAIVLALLFVVLAVLSLTGHIG